VFFLSGEALWIALYDSIHIYGKCGISLDCTCFAKFYLNKNTSDIHHHSKTMYFYSTVIIISPTDDNKALESKSKPKTPQCAIQY